MPLYEYTCEACEHTFESLVFGDEKVTCPECESDKLHKLMSVPGLAQVAAPSGGGCGDPSLPPCGAPWCQRKGT
jgi:putative FmdB family regulatory protein